MERIELTKDEMQHFLFETDRIGIGFSGIVSEYNKDTLIKIYYKRIYNTYILGDVKLLDREIELEKEINKRNKSFEVEYRNAQKESVLEDIGLLKGKVYYNGYQIGILLEYYRDYIRIDELFERVDKSIQQDILKRVKEMLDGFLKKNMYLNDISERHILIHPETLDIKFIDLDDDYTTYEDKEYIADNELYSETTIFSGKYKEMVYRLTKPR